MSREASRDVFFDGIDVLKREVIKQCHKTIFDNTSEQTLTHNITCSKQS